MYANKSDDVIIQNLKDAGCDTETIENFMSDLQKGDEKSSLKRLDVHRKNCLILSIKNKNVLTVWITSFTR